MPIQSPRNFVCASGCRRESMLPLETDHKTCFTHGAPYREVKPVTMEALDVSFTDDELAELLEGV